jgi:hypothetical protein
LTPVAMHVDASATMGTRCKVGRIVLAAMFSAAGSGDSFVQFLAGKRAVCKGSAW